MSEKLTKALAALRKAREEDATASVAKEAAEKALCDAKVESSRAQATKNNAQAEVDRLVAIETAPAVEGRP